MGDSCGGLLAFGQFLPVPVAVPGWWGVFGEAEHVVPFAEEGGEFGVHFVWVGVFIGRGLVCVRERVGASDFYFYKCGFWGGSMSRQQANILGERALLKRLRELK